jgi:hypothetical protein
VPLGEDYGPGIDGKAKEKDEDGGFRGSATLDHSPEIYLKKEGNRRFERQSIS